ncbi:MAG TPA: putative ABC transporter permease [Galbitalea sp.]
MSIVLLYLACYSFIGWIVEVLWVFAKSQHLENRGFLTGPFLPIYGIGAIVLILFVEPYVSNPFLVFLASVVATSTLEYLSSLILDKLFHISLWDYHDRRFNLNGRICLENSLAFGALGLLLIYVLQPLISRGLTALPADAAIAVAWALIGILLVDSANSIRSLAKVRPVLDELHGTLVEAHSHIEARAVRLHQARLEQQSGRRSLSGATLTRLGRVFPRAQSVRRAARMSSTAPARYQKAPNAE